MSEANLSPRSVPRLAQAVAERFALLSQVEAVALGGSRTAALADEQSDLDFYVYVREEIPPRLRAEIVRCWAERTEIDNRFWETGDEWVDLDTGLHVDIMYRSPAWMEAQLDRVLVSHEASVGYSTCFWWNVKTSLPLFDRHGWLSSLQARAEQPYPELLVRAVVAKNHPILRKNLSSYLHQLETAVRRDDPVSVNHRIAAVVASYFDILFAVNRVPHPGEKRLLTFARELCPRRPADLEGQVLRVLAAACFPLDMQRLTAAVDSLLDGLDHLLSAEGLLGTPD